MGKAFMITGTDTGVGKTFIACCLIESFKKMNFSVFPFKPIETGADPDPEDAKRLINHSGIKADLNKVCPFRFRYPLAPMVAERIEGLKINIEKIKEIYEEAFKNYDIIIAEGAGGLLVPITEKITYADLAVYLNTPIVVVAKSKLGTINHTLLTVRMARAYGLKVVCVILNKFEGKDIAERTNPETIAELTNTKVFTVSDMRKPYPLMEIAEFIYENL